MNLTHRYKNEKKKTILHGPKLRWETIGKSVIPEMGGRRRVSGCARGWGRRVSGCHWQLLGKWLSSAVASCCAVAGGSYGLDYYRLWLGHGILGGLGFDFFPLFLSLSLWVFIVSRKYRIFFGKHRFIFFLN